LTHCLFKSFEPSLWMPPGLKMNGLPIGGPSWHCWRVFVARLVLVQGFSTALLRVIFFFYFFIFPGLNPAYFLSTDVIGLMGPVAQYLNARPRGSSSLTFLVCPIRTPGETALWTPQHGMLRTTPLPRVLCPCILFDHSPDSLKTQLGDGFRQTYQILFVFSVVKDL